MQFQAIQKWLELNEGEIKLVNTLMRWITDEDIFDLGPALEDRSSRDDVNIKYYCDLPRKDRDLMLKAWASCGCWDEVAPKTVDLSCDASMMKDEKFMSLVKTYWGEWNEHKRAAKIYDEFQKEMIELEKSIASIKDGG